MVKVLSVYKLKQSIKCYKLKKVYTCIEKEVFLYQGYLLMKIITIEFLGWNFAILLMNEFILKKVIFIFHFKF